MTDLRDRAVAAAKAVAREAMARNSGATCADLVDAALVEFRAALLADPDATAFQFAASNFPIRTSGRSAPDG